MEGFSPGTPRAWRRTACFWVMAMNPSTPFSQTLPLIGPNNQGGNGKCVGAKWPRRRAKHVPRRELANQSCSAYHKFMLGLSSSLVGPASLSTVLTDQRRGELLRENVERKSRPLGMTKDIIMKNNGSDTFRFHLSSGARALSL